MIGRVGASGRALVQIVVMSAGRNSPLAIEAWIDTGFTGELVLPHAVISDLGLLQSGTVEAELGDGSSKVLRTYSCSMEWFGLEQQIEVVANDGGLPLLGVGLLRERKLTVDYAANTLSVE
jgi:clan AA aspartic protease